MAHATNIISQIKLPNGVTYEIHDPHAFHAPGDLGISGALIFKGVLADETKLPAATNLTIGHVYLIGAMEYVGVEDTTSTPASYKWEKLGNIHDAASSTHVHTVTVTGTNGESNVTGYVNSPAATPTVENVTGTAAAQAVTTTTDTVIGVNDTHTATVSGAPGKTVKYMKATTTLSGMGLTHNGTANLISSITPSTASFINTVSTTPVNVVSSITPATSDALVSINTSNSAFITKINPVNTKVINAVTPTTSAALTSLTPVNVTAINIPKVNSWGTNSTWNFNVSSAGVLEITGANSSIPTTNGNYVVSQVGTNGNTSVASSSTTNITANFVTGVTTNSRNVVGSFNSANTANAITAVDPSASAFVTSVGTTPAAVISSVNTTNANAVTGVTPTYTNNVWTSTKFNGTPSASTSLATQTNSATGTAGVVTEVSAGTLAVGVVHDQKDNVESVVTVTTSASNVTLSKNVVTAVNTTNVRYNLISGKAAPQTWTQGLGSTGEPTQTA